MCTEDDIRIFVEYMRIPETFVCGDESNKINL